MPNDRSDMSANSHFVTNMELRYHDVLDWPKGETSEDHGSPYPGHTPIYPNEESFMQVLGEMCRDLKQSDLTAVPAFLQREEGGAEPSTPVELFHLIENTG